MYDKKRLKQIIAVSVAIVIVIIAISIFNILKDQKYSATIDIVVAPKKAVLTLNGQEYNNGTYRLVPGSYDVSLTADGFEPFYGVIELPAGETTYLYQYLTGPDGDISYYLDESNKEDASLFLTISNHDIDLKARSYIEKDKVFTITPYYDINKNHFIINAGLNENGSITITVNLNACVDLLKNEYIAEANAYLENHGLNLDDYVMTYVGLCD